MSVVAIVLNQPSLEKFEPKVKPGGILFYESNNILNPPTRTDIEVYSIPANVEADKIGNKKTLNMIILGAYLSKKPLVSHESIMEGLSKVLPERNHHLLPINEKALQHGMTLLK